MPHAQPLVGVLDACERLRRLPAARWQQPPRPPLGSMPPGSPPPGPGATLQEQVLGAIDALMADDAAARGVTAFTPQVTALALPDVLAALARSVHARGDEAGQEHLRVLAAQLRDW